MPPPGPKRLMNRWWFLVGRRNQQIYISRSKNPYLNLAIENYLLRFSPPESVILFLYVNKPCVVIGRNQNPWLEVNLHLLHQRNQEATGGRPSRSIALVRRRSGGGTVFHDEGNVNYSVISPAWNFARDKHAEMVAKAIRRFNATARVNERHDIVIDSGLQSDALKDVVMKPLKVSGSAYKFIRNRALHHGTLLLTSPNLRSISTYLSSPGRPFLSAKGVESVRSPVANVFPRMEQHTESVRLSVQKHLIQAFQEMYFMDAKDYFRSLPRLASRGVTSETKSGDLWAAGTVSKELALQKDVLSDMSILESEQWTYEQTPKFTVNSHPVHDQSEDQSRPSPVLPEYFPQSARVFLKVERGRFVESKIKLPPLFSHEAEQPGQDESDSPSSSKERNQRINQLLKDKSIHEIKDFRHLLLAPSLDPVASDLYGNVDGDSVKVMQWLNEVFGKYTL